MQDPSTPEELFAKFLASLEERGGSGSDARSEAGERAFEEWLATVSAGAPDLTRELRALRSEWLAFAPVLDRHRPPSRRDEGAERLLRRLGERDPLGERFEQRSEIGAGGMGRVYRVFDPELDRELALKMPRDDGPPRNVGTVRTGTRRRVERLLAEARITGQLHHPGIVPVHEVGRDADGRVYYTMPLIEGEDLERVFERHAAGDAASSTARILTHLLRVCETMDYAHARGVVHADLKPSNIRIGRFGEVTVMDWGLARKHAQPGVASVDMAPVDGAAAEEEPGTDLADAASLTRVNGTMGYLAPERIRAPHAPPDPRADVYAVGAMLFRLVAGDVPYADALRRAEDIDDLRSALAGPAPAVHALASDAPPELLSITARATAALEERYGDMRSLANDLRAFLEGRVVASHASGPAAELRKWVERNRGWAATLLGLALSLAVGLVVASFLTWRAERERTRVLRLSDLRRHSELVERADELWPALPERAAAYAAWLDEANRLRARLAEHRATLAGLRADGLGEDATGWTFEENEDQWHHDTLAALVDELARFADPGDGLIADVEERLAFAESIEARSLTSAAAAQAWDEALRAIADRDASPEYDGLRLAPQLGLLPLGADPASGLFEFAHLATGTPAVRDADGALRLDESTGVVLVLVPGGSFLMGAQAAEAGAPGYVERAMGNEGPPHRVRLAPFFVSKYELTQAQWLRMTGANPSTHRPDSTAVSGITLLHPVETVGRSECARVLARRGLALPTEAQWEYAARAGASGVWWTGERAESVTGAANLADRSALDAGYEWPQIETWLDDGFERHAPVDALRPNRFGLVHVHGNVWEWCRDDFADYAEPAREGDGLRRESGTGLAVGRGGGYVNNAAFARLTLRDARPDAAHVLYGVRPLRPVL